MQLREFLLVLSSYLMLREYAEATGGQKSLNPEGKTLPILSPYAESLFSRASVPGWVKVDSTSFLLGESLAPLKQIIQSVPT